MMKMRLNETQTRDTTIFYIGEMIFKQPAISPSPAPLGSVYLIFYVPNAVAGGYDLVLDFALRSLQSPPPPDSSRPRRSHCISSRRAIAISLRRCTRIESPLRCSERLPWLCACQIFRRRRTSNQHQPVTTTQCDMAHECNDSQRQNGSTVGTSKRQCSRARHTHMRIRTAEKLQIFAIFT